MEKLHEGYCIGPVNYLIVISFSICDLHWKAKFQKFQKSVDPK